MAQPSASPDLIAFLQALPERRQRRWGALPPVVAAVDGHPWHPQWLSLDTRDLERFAKRHHQEFGAILGLTLPKAPCDSTFLYLFERVDLKQVFASQKPGGYTQNSFDTGESHERAAL